MNLSPSSSLWASFAVGLLKLIGYTVRVGASLGTISPLRHRASEAPFQKELGRPGLFQQNPLFLGNSPTWQRAAMLREALNTHAEGTHCTESASKHHNWEHKTFYLQKLEFVI